MAQALIGHDSEAIHQHHVSVGWTAFEQAGRVYPACAKVSAPTRGLYPSERHWYGGGFLVPIRGGYQENVIDTPLLRFSVADPLKMSKDRLRPGVRR